MENIFYNGIKLPALPQTNFMTAPRIPYMIIMPDGSVEDANRMLRGYLPETENE